MLKQRSSRYLLVSAAIALALVVVASSQKPISPESKPFGPHTHMPVSSSVSQTLSEPPAGYEKLATAQKLDRAQTLPGVRGVVEGVVGIPVSHWVAWRSSGMPSDLVTDFPLKVLQYIGSGPDPYNLGSQITLRIPGGQIGRTTQVWEGTPEVRPGAHVFVFLRDQGVVVGGNAATVLVASSTGDVLEVRNGLVVGQGESANFREPIDQFRRHFHR